MTNKEISFKIHQIYPEISALKITKILERMVNIITETVRQNEPVKISRLGVFVLKNIKGREGVNPRTKEKMMIPEYRAIKFRASDTIKKEIKR